MQEFALSVAYRGRRNKRNPGGHSPNKFILLQSVRDSAGMDGPQTEKEATNNGNRKVFQNRRVPA